MVAYRPAVSRIGAESATSRSLPAVAADKTAGHPQIQATDRQIEESLYELYGLMEKEVAAVRGAMG